MVIDECIGGAVVVIYVAILIISTQQKGEVSMWYGASRRKKRVTLKKGHRGSQTFSDRDLRRSSITIHDIIESLIQRGTSCGSETEIYIQYSKGHYLVSWDVARTS